MAAKSTGGLTKRTSYSPGAPKKSRQGQGAGTKLSATLRLVMQRIKDIEDKENR